MASPGTLNLDELIKSMNPTLASKEYVFVKLSSDSPKLRDVVSRMSDLSIKMLFQESERWTVILPKSGADDEGLEFAFPCRQITLNVHSSLEAVGFLAAVTTRLATNLSIGVNPVSGFYHDHLFVPAGKEGAVMKELKRMTVEQK